MSGSECIQPLLPGIPAALQRELTAEPRRYGFHATLKSPFQLASGISEADVASLAISFAAQEIPIVLEDIRIQVLRDFLALMPCSCTEEVARLAMRCVSHFDHLRKAMTEAELEKRLTTGLSARQEALLRRWGYPYTEDEFRFHMTLTRSLKDIDEKTACALRKAADDHFTPIPATTPLIVDALTIFREDRPGAPFLAWKRFPFTMRETIQRHR